MASRRDELREDMRLRVMRLLAEDPTLSTRQIADAVGVSNGAAYYCVSALVDRGHVKVGNFKSSARKVQYAYVLTPKGLAEKSRLAARFLERKLAEFEALREEIEALEMEVGADAGAGATE